MSKVINGLAGETDHYGFKRLSRTAEAWTNLEFDIVEMLMN